MNANCACPRQSQLRRDDRSAALIGVIADDRLPPAPPPGVDRRLDRGRADRLRDVPLCRRSGEPDGRDRDLRLRNASNAPSTRPRSARDRPGGAVSHERGAVRFRRVLPVQAAGRRPDRRAHARDPRARAGRVDPIARRGRADGRLRRPAPRQRAGQPAPGAVAHRHIAADVSDRHPDDLSVRGRASAGCRRSGAATWCGSARGGRPGCSRSRG